MRAEGDPRKLLNILDEVYGEPIQVQQVKYTRELATFCWNEGENLQHFVGMKARTSKNTSQDSPTSAKN